MMLRVARRHKLTHARLYGQTATAPAIAIAAPPRGITGLTISSAPSPTPSSSPPPPQINHVTPPTPSTSAPSAPSVTSREFLHLLRKICPERFLPPRLGLAISGGVDSMALAHLTSTLPPPHRPLEIHAFIVDHLCRPTSTSDAHSVAAYLSDHYGFTTHVLPLAPPHPCLPPLHLSPKHSFESTARQYRWHILTRECLKHKVAHLVLAHHTDDQAETVLMRILKGTGYAGAAGMKPITNVPESRGVRGAMGMLSVLRPFLGRASQEEWGGGGGERMDISKDRLISTCVAAGVPWWEDPTNSDKTYTMRNAVRHLLRPQLTSDPTTQPDYSHLPRALQPSSLLAFSRRVNHRVFLEDTSMSQTLLALGPAQLTICTFSSCAWLSLPRLPAPTQTQTQPPPSPSLSALARTLQKLVDLLSPLKRSDSRPLRNLAIPSLFFPETLSHGGGGGSGGGLRTFTAGGLLWTPEAGLCNTPGEPRSVWILSRQPPTRNLPADPLREPEMHMSCIPGSDSDWRLYDGRFFLRRRWTPKISQSLASRAPALKIRFLKADELGKVKREFSSPLDGGGWAKAGLLKSQSRPHESDGEKPRARAVLGALTAWQVDMLLGGALKRVPGYARFVIPVAELVDENEGTGIVGEGNPRRKIKVGNTEWERGKVVGFPTLGLWLRGVFPEYGGPDTSSTNSTTTPQPHPPEYPCTGTIECVIRGRGEYIGEDIPSAGLGRGWEVTWVSGREGQVGLGNRRRERGRRGGADTIVRE